MEKFAQIELILNKNITKGKQESLLSLFNAVERFKSMDILLDKEENSAVKVVLEGVGEVVLKLGDDMEKGQKKTIMTLFWYRERSKLFEIQRDVKAGEVIQLTMWESA